MVTSVDWSGSVGSRRGGEQEQAPAAMLALKLIKETVNESGELMGLRNK